MGKSNPLYTTFDPLVLAEMSRHVDAVTAHKFACKVRVDASGCWLWIASKDKDGYGIFSWREEGDTLIHHTMRAHRFSFRASHGWVPRELDHLACDRKNCVHPYHCVPTTTRENIARTNNVTAVNSRKTKCKRGHELSVHPGNPNWRRCEVCNSEANLRSQRRRYTRTYQRTSTRKMPPRKFASYDVQPQMIPTED